MIIFDSAQTYIGVLATFLVLCLFNNDNGNFLYSIFVKIGESIIKILTDYILELKHEINSIYENKKERKIERTSELQLKANIDDKKKLLENRNAARIQENKFFMEAIVIMNRFDPKKEIAQKEELTYIALFLLIVIIVSMLVDFIELISIETRSIYINILISVSMVYSFFLYRNFFKENQRYKDSNIKNEINPDRFKKPVKKRVIIKAFSFFILWLFLSLFINTDWFSISLLPLILWVGFLFTKNKWLDLCDKYNKYNRLFILKHSIYILIFSGFCAFLTKILISYNWIYTFFEQKEQIELLNDWNNSIVLLQNPFLAKYISVVFFTLNGFFLPLLFGYIYLIRKEHRIIDEIKAVQELYKSRVLKYEEEFKSIENKIDCT